MSTWSDPVEGRQEGSQWWKAGNMWGLWKARSMDLGLWSRGKESKCKFRECYGGRRLNLRLGQNRGPISSPR